MSDSDSDISDSTPRPSARSKERKNHVLDEQTRKLVLHVLQRCVEEKNAGKFTLPVAHLEERALYYTGMPHETIQDIQLEIMINPITAVNNASSNKNKYLKINDFDRSVVAGCIQEMFLSTKENIKAPELLLYVQKKIDFPWGMITFRKLIYEIGFMWKTTDSGRILVESPKAVLARNKYLEDIRQYRQQGRKVFYLLETILDKCHLKLRANKNKPKQLIENDFSTKHRLILVHSGTECQFLNGKNVLYKACTVSSVIEEVQSNIVIESWINGVVIPNLPPNTVILMDLPTLCMQGCCIPQQTSLRSEYINWLEIRNIEFSANSDNVDLYTLIISVISQFKIENIIEKHGHEVMKLPVFMYDLNPIEAAWGKIKRKVAELTTPSNLDLSAEAFNKIAEMAIVKAQQISESEDNGTKEENDQSVCEIKEEKDQIDEDMEDIPNVTPNAEIKEEEEYEEIYGEAVSDSEISVKMEFECDSDTTFHK